jgi:acid phosphatase (class A)
VKTFLTSILVLGAMIYATSVSHAQDARAALGHLPDGYVTSKVLPDSLALVPPPPQYGSARKATDDATAAAAIKIQDTARFDLAIRDANLHFPEATDAFACALGARITVEDTPRLQKLMVRSMVDAGLSTYGAKEKYQRKRPFVENRAPICTPEDEKVLRNDGSYPSGHTAVGWAWALILSELAPDRADALLARGIEFGESRIICNVHWRNDVTAGRLMGASAVALMHANPEFIADMKAARAELAEAPPLSGVNCAAEAKALNIRSLPPAQ